MKRVEIQIYDDWHEIIASQYKLAKDAMDKHGLSIGTLEEFITEFVGQMLLRECNEEYMDMFDEQHNLRRSGVLPFKPRAKR